MCDWQDVNVRGRIFSAKVIRDACEIIRQTAQKGELIYYSDLIKRLKQLGHKHIDRFVIGDIVGEVSIQVSRLTAPSIYPSAIVVRKDTKEPGDGFWGLDTGTNPPNKLPPHQKRNGLEQYQRDVWQVNKWSCAC